MTDSICPFFFKKLLLLISTSCITLKARPRIFCNPKVQFEALFIMINIWTFSYKDRAIDLNIFVSRGCVCHIIRYLPSKDGSFVLIMKLLFCLE